MSKRRIHESVGGGAGYVIAAVVIATGAGLNGCSSYRDSSGSASVAEAVGTEANEVIDNFRQKDPTLGKFFDNAYGYAVFPKIGKGAVGIGAANGDGVVYEQGVLVGTSEMTQVTVGFQLGGQTYSEIIFFQNKWNLESFKAGNFEFAANASAIAAESGAAATNDFSNGIAVFTMPRGGLMFEASIGGQKFSYKPIR
ncbi:MAG: YSC84-related protein [Phycisphaerales bacterium]